MFKLISDIMAHWYDMWYTVVIANDWNAKEIILALMLIISNHHGINYLISLLQAEPVMLCL